MATAAPVLGSSGRLKAAEVSDTDRTFAVFMNLSLFATLIVPVAYFTPLVLWLIRKDKSAFADDHGRETMNLMISGVLMYVGSLAAVIPTFGMAAVAVIVWQVIIAIAMIRGAVAASNMEYFRYPMIVRFIK